MLFSVPAGIQHFYRAKANHQGEEITMKLSVKEKASYGLGAVGKDMVYALSATYVLYYLCRKELLTW